MKLTRQLIILLILNLALFYGITFTQEGKTIEQKEKKEAEKYIGLCKSSLEKEKPDEAVKYAIKAVEIDDSNSQYHYWLGQAYGLKAQKASIFSKFSYAKKCKKEWIKAVELDPENIEARMGLLNYYLQAPGIAGGSNKKAKQQAAEVIKIDPLRGHMAMAQIHEDEKDFSKAEQEYIKATEVNPEDTGPYYSLGYFYQNREKYDKARETFFKILKIDSVDMGAYYQLGRTAVYSGENLKEGITYFKKYLEHKPKLNNPTWAYAHWRLGMVYEKLGNKEQAISEYEKAIELDPDNKEAKESLKKVK